MPPQNLKSSKSALRWQLWCYLTFSKFVEAPPTLPFWVSCIVFYTQSLILGEYGHPQAFPWESWDFCNLAPTLQTNCGHRSTYLHNIPVPFVWAICPQLPQLSQITSIVPIVGKVELRLTVGGEAPITRFTHSHGKDVHIHCHDVPHHVWEQYPKTKEPCDLIQMLDKS